MTRILIVLFSLSFLIACGDDGGAPTPPPPPNFSRDSGTSTEDDCTPESDEALCTLHEAECGELIVLDTCGEERVVDCGDGAELCAAPETCGGGEKPNVCGCAGEPDEELCEAAEAECGSIEVTDRCGLDRAINCGDEAEVCEAPFTCGGGENPNACGCTAEESDEALCAENGAQCGELVIEDSCGILRTIESCGECEGFDVCAGGGAANVCGCTPDELDAVEVLCAAAGAECGKIEVIDSCGLEHTFNCGDESEVCEAPSTCGGGGTANVCGCTPFETDEELCIDARAECDTLTTINSCGESVTIPSCGECTGVNSCGGGGEANVCGCTGEPDDILCGMEGAECGGISVVDSCGEPRFPECGSAEEVCKPFETCGAEEPNICGCVAATCETLNVACGTPSNGCNGDALQCDNFCVDLVRAGQDHACALATGKLRCWGRGQDGRLGAGNTTNRRIPHEVNLAGVVDLGLGGAHSCAILYDGSALCWGKNSHGQLGDGTTEDILAPLLTKKVFDAGVEKIGGGAEHSCAIVGGGVFCWGSNQYGQIGDFALDYGSQVTVPQAVHGLGAGIVDLAVGAHHSCALSGDGDVHCWGRNHRGQLGNLEVSPTGKIRKSGPPCDFEDLVAFGVETTGANALDLGTRFESHHSRPFKVEGLPSDIIEVTAGAGYSCALSEAGDLFCWGALTMGFNTLASACTGAIDGKNPAACAIWPPLALADDPHVAPLVRFSELCCGSGEETVCESHGFAELYLNRAALLPIQVTTDVESIAGGDNHICFIKRDIEAPATNVHCFGANSSGQVGDGSDNNWGAPRVTTVNHQTGLPLRAVGLSIGGSFSCANTDDPGTAQCWGGNTHGQIGNDSLQLNESTFQPYDVKFNVIP